MADLRGDDEDRHWQESNASRPSGKGGKYNVFRPGHRYANGDVERDLERDWESHPHQGTSTWQQVKELLCVMRGTV